MNPKQIDILLKIEALDNWFLSKIPQPLSLDPLNETVSLTTLLSSWEWKDCNNYTDILRVYRAILETSIRNFPNNIFWDFNFLFYYIFENGKNNKSYLEKFQRKIENLFNLFGGKDIHFRYLHDFIYGFDSFKWFTMKRNEKSDSDPFGFSFIQYMEDRGKEIVSLIQEDNANYPKLENSEFRNPFFFSRDPKDEMILFQTLRDRNLIPFDMWEKEAILKTNLNYMQMRLDLAIELGLKENIIKGAHKI